jgi:hypothetical protein
MLQPQWEGHDIPTPSKFIFDVVIDGRFYAVDKIMSKQCNVEIEEPRSLKEAFLAKIGICPPHRIEIRLPSPLIIFSVVNVNSS